MNKGDFFVMLTTQNGGYTPLMLCADIASDEAVLAKFATEQEARDVAKRTVLGEAFGYEVFEIGCGC
ncbi:hypothetical protein [Vibrio alginolyticus]|uniref:hypothetical protein n=1 Tax=Vibrio TaxID=662 RepID=UPI0006CA8D6D|nr:hypothetical protein [Vibrio alginolyticus]KPM98549.1 hypothetical protein AOG25_08915 [Vibrio alginolyticus]CAH7152218.1 conserved hypothetical protein [Vibrio chagasii]